MKKLKKVCLLTSLFMLSIGFVSCNQENLSSQNSLTPASVESKPSSSEEPTTPEVIVDDVTGKKYVFNDLKIVDEDGTAVTSAPEISTDMFGMMEVLNLANEGCYIEFTNDGKVLGTCDLGAGTFDSLATDPDSDGVFYYTCDTSLKKNSVEVFMEDNEGKKNEQYSMKGDSLEGVLVLLINIPLEETDEPSSYFIDFTSQVIVD